MALLSSIPRFRSLYSRYFSTISATSLWALAVFWYLDESLITLGEESARVSSSYLASIWFSLSNILSLRSKPLLHFQFAKGRSALHHAARRPWASRLLFRQLNFTTAFKSAFSSCRGNRFARPVLKSQPRRRTFTRILHWRHVAGSGQH